MKLNLNYLNHNFIKIYEFGFSDYECSECGVIAIMLGQEKYIHFFSIKYSEFEFGMFSEETLPTCHEVIIKKLLE